MRYEEHIYEVVKDEFTRTLTDLVMQRVQLVAQKGGPSDYMTLQARLYGSETNLTQQFRVSDKQLAAFGPDFPREIGKQLARSMFYGLTKARKPKDFSQVLETMTKTEE